MGTPYKVWQCRTCGYIYEEAVGEPAEGLPSGTRWDDVPEDFRCPLCGRLAGRPLACPSGGGYSGVWVGRGVAWPPDREGLLVAHADLLHGLCPDPFAVAAALPALG